MASPRVLVDMTEPRQIQNVEALSEDQRRTWPNEQLQRFMAVSARSFNGIGRQYLEDVEALEPGTDFS